MITLKDEQDGNARATLTNGALRQVLYRAAIQCDHEITEEAVYLYANPKQSGNALSQLADRLEAAATFAGVSERTCCSSQEKPAVQLTLSDEAIVEAEFNGAALRRNANELFFWNKPIETACRSYFKEGYEASERYLDSRLRMTSLAPNVSARERRVADLVNKLRGSDNLARRDKLLEQIVGLFVEDI